VTIVVSPLVSLVQDQVTALKNNNVSACAFEAGSNRQLEDEIISGAYDIVYLTPEKLLYWQQGLTALQQGVGILMFVVDEAHCVSHLHHNACPLHV
jgi:ATP-dependent DNA helicase RecQ